MEKQQRNGQQRGLKNFVKNDPRINRSGRPRGFDEMRKMAQKSRARRVIDERGIPMTCAEAVLRSWAKSDEIERYWDIRPATTEKIVPLVAQH